MSFKHGLIFLSLFCGYNHANLFPVDPDPSPLLVDPAARPIVGGDVAPPGSAPHMVALIKDDQFHCGGSLISSWTVLTAAHCLDHTTSSSLRGLVGTNSLNSGGIWISFQKLIMHPYYNRPPYANDIGLLITTQPVQFSALVKPIALSYQHVGGGVRVKANGWGQTSEPGIGSNELLQLFQITVDTAECQRQTPSLDPASMLCAVNSVGHGLCRGDSGSAVVRADNGQQVGVASWVIPCALGYPDGLARVSAFQQFIETHKK